LDGVLSMSSSVGKAIRRELSGKLDWDIDLDEIREIDARSRLA
jgi:hypothetical protein